MTNGRVEVITSVERRRHHPAKRLAEFLPWNWRPHNLPAEAALPQVPTPLVDLLGVFTGCVPIGQ
jgi:hypothetical protein